MFNGVKVYKGTKLTEKVAIISAQVRVKIVWLLKRVGQTIEIASIILTDICGVLRGLRRSEFLAKVESKPNRTTLLCFRNLSGYSWDLGDLKRR